MGTWRALHNFSLRLQQAVRRAFRHPSSSLVSSPLAYLFFPCVFSLELPVREKGAALEPSLAKSSGLLTDTCWSENWTDLSDFGDQREGVQKSSFFGIAPKDQKSKHKSNLGSPCRYLKWKNMTFQVPIGIVFWNDLNSIKVFIVQYVSMVFNHRKPLIFR